MNIRRFLIPAFCLFFALTAASCDKKSTDSDEDDYLKIDKSELTFAFDELFIDQEVAIGTNVSSFSLSLEYEDSADTGWISYEKCPKSVVVGVITENNGSGKRKATLTITAGDASPKTVSITQNPEAAEGN